VGHEGSHVVPWATGCTQAALEAAAESLPACLPDHFDGLFERGYGFHYMVSSFNITLAVATSLSLLRYSFFKLPRYAMVSLYVFDVDRARQINLVFSKKN
jgi:hypothetical protein